MMGLSPPGSSARGTSPSHRRNSSLEPSTAATLGSSPVKVKLLNGRVYGSRRASEAAAREKESRERLEPAFIEWGHGKAGGGIGSNAPKTAGGGFLEEEGSGMEWVKRRKERREQEARERREREAQSGESGAESDAPPMQPVARHVRANGSNDELRSAPAPSPGRAPRLSSSQSSDDERGPRTLATPNIRSSELPPTPLIRVTEVPNLSAQLDSTLRTPLSEEPPHTQAIKIAPQAAGSRRDGYGAEVFDEGLPRRRRSGRSDDEGDGGDEEDEDEDEEEEDDGDFEDDEEEEEDVGRSVRRVMDVIWCRIQLTPNRTTATAAGIEVVSRHH